MSEVEKLFTKTFAKMLMLYAAMCITVIGINLALLAAAAWVVVKVLQWMGVL
jgi:hypothetical protein